MPTKVQLSGLNQLVSDLMAAKSTTAQYVLALRLIVLVLCSGVSICHHEAQQQRYLRR